LDEIKKKISIFSGEKIIRRINFFGRKNHS